MAPPATRTQASAAPVASFAAEIERIGTRDLVRLPADASGALSSRGQVAAAVTIDDSSFQTVIEPDGRKGHWIPVTSEMRAAADSDTPSITIEPAERWPEPTVPADLQSALDSDAANDALWQDITPMARWEWVRWVGATKSPETRQRRVDVTISKLQDGKRRPCCFDLSSCTDPEVAKSGKLPDPR